MIDLGSTQPNMRVAWFTFGPGQEHTVSGFVFDQDMVLQMTAANPRDAMSNLFGDQWSTEYSEPPDLTNYPRGIVKFDGSGMP